MGDDKNKITVEPLARGHRRGLFLLLFLLFVVAVPLAIFYAIGYRYNVLNPVSTLTSTGGMYVAVLGDSGVIFINDEPARTTRAFRGAYYIRSVEPGVQRVHVQYDGLQTWVKELPVYAHIVTDVEAFLMPERPQVRPITEFLATGNAPVYFGATSTVPFSFASSTASFVVVPENSPVTAYTRNSEYVFVSNLMDNIEMERATLLSRITGGVTNTFQFPGGRNNQSTTTATSSATSSDTSTSTVVAATTTKESSGMRLIETGEREISAVYVGPARDIPSYFCSIDRSSVDGVDTFTTTLPIQDNLSDVLRDQGERNSEFISGRFCRKEVTISTEHQEIYSFDFFPGSSDLVVVHREDGVYVTEIDNRSWQNSQQLYPASADLVVVSGGRIYVKDGEQVFELLTRLISVI